MNFTECVARRIIGFQTVALASLICGGVAMAKEEPAAAPISISDNIPFARAATTNPGSPISESFTQNQVEQKCGLGQRLSDVIAQGARRQRIVVHVTPALDEAEGRILVMEIEGVTGRVGGAMTGTKALTVRGELRSGETVIGSFVARRQRTALAAGTCKALTDAVEKLAKDIVKWLRDPVMKARLGTA
jgi:hypothetical protein